MAINDPLIGSELGIEFDQGVIQANTIRLKIGSGLAIQPDGTIVATSAPTSTTFVDTSSTAISYLNGSDIHNNGAVVGFASDDLDTGWTRTANVFSYAGTADEVQITVNIFANDTGASNYWSRPSLRISDGAGVVAEIDDLVMQQNGQYSGNCNISGSVTLKNQINPSYIFEWFDSDNRTSTLTPIPSSHIALKATKKIEVYAV